MGDRADICVEQRRKKMAEELWLNYFNRTLLERGVISQAEHNRMVALIANRSSQRKSSTGNNRDQDKQKLQTE